MSMRLSLVFSMMFYSFSSAVTHLVPSQYGTIQSAVDASADGDTVLVSAGVYRDAVNFKGKAILIQSVSGPEATRIDASSLYAVTFESDEDTLSVLSGFSIGPEGSDVHSNWNGILCSGSSPTIEGNVIERLKRAVMVVKGSPVIKRNLIREGIWIENTSGIFIADTCSPVIVNNIIYGYYHGVRISGSTPRILFNTLDQNKYGIFGADSCIVVNNIISNGSTNENCLLPLTCTKTTPILLTRPRPSNSLCPNHAKLDLRFTTSWVKK
jgi:hypothetical protein